MDILFRTIFYLRANLHPDPIIIYCSGFFSKSQFQFIYFACPQNVQINLLLQSTATVAKYKNDSVIYFACPQNVQINLLLQSTATVAKYKSDNEEKQNFGWHFRGFSWEKRFGVYCCRRQKICFGGGGGGEILDILFRTIFYLRANLHPDPIIIYCSGFFSKSQFQFIYFACPQNVQINLLLQSTATVAKYKNDSVIYFACPQNVQINLLLQSTATVAKYKSDNEEKQNFGWHFRGFSWEKRFGVYCCRRQKICFGGGGGGEILDILFRTIFYLRANLHPDPIIIYCSGFFSKSQFQFIYFACPQNVQINLLLQSTATVAKYKNDSEEKQNFGWHFRGFSWEKRFGV